MGGAPGLRPRGDYRIPFDLTCVLEILLAVYCAATVAIQIRDGRWLAIPFLTLFVFGFLTMAAGTILETVRARRAASPTDETAAPRAAPELVGATASETTKGTPA